MIFHCKHSDEKCFLFSVLTSAKWTTRGDAYLFNSWRNARIIDAVRRRMPCLRPVKHWNVDCIAFPNGRWKGRERERKMEREGHTVKVFAKDKPQTSKVDVPSEWTPSGIHSTPCDRGLFVTARKKLDTLCLQLEAPWDALNVSKALPVIHHFQMFELNFDEYFNFYERITIVDSWIFMKAKCRWSSGIWVYTIILLRNSVQYIA